METLRVGPAGLASGLEMKGREMSAKFLAVVEDLFFLAKIQQTARQLGLAVEAVQPDAVQTRLADGNAATILLDLNHRSGNAIRLIESLKSDPATRSVPVIAFLSHVQGDLAQAARSAGCARVMARSAFSRQLAAILQEMSKDVRGNGIIA
jgi:CheY-like chemotaxis protein